ncbi:MAG: MBL fold metallo-hydrolase [Rubrobacter sp.]|nr:MBL fold metallo-hydrolase [Rubrobacter sp.]
MSIAPEPFVFFQRSFPSANMVLVKGDRPILVDSGFGGDIAETRHLLRQAGYPPESVTLIVNSHYHCDHAGGNHALQRDHNIPIAAHRWEAGLLNRRDREACSAEWLAQPMEPYAVTRYLSDGDRIEAGGVSLEVIETPGHTLGHVSLYSHEDRVLIGGDLFHSDDVAWLNPYREGVGAISRAIESLDRVAGLKITWASSGHGEAITDPKSAIEAARARYGKWLEEPERAAWHACKRIFAYALMLTDGMNEEKIYAYLLGAPWFMDFSRHAFGEEEAHAFVGPLIAEMLRSNAAEWRESKLIALSPYNPPPLGWPDGPSKPKEW